MMGVVIFLAVVALGVATWGMSKLSKWLERSNVPGMVFYPVMATLLVIAGGGFMLAIQFANTFA